MCRTVLIITVRLARTQVRGGPDLLLELDIGRECVGETCRVGSLRAQPAEASRGECVAAGRMIVFGRGLNAL